MTALATSTPRRQHQHHEHETATRRRSTTAANCAPADPPPKQSRYNLQMPLHFQDPQDSRLAQWFRRQMMLLRPRLAGDSEPLRQSSWGSRVRYPFGGSDCADVGFAARTVLSFFARWRYRYCSLSLLTFVLFLLFCIWHLRRVS